MDERIRVPGARPISRKQSHGASKQRKEWDDRFWVERIPNYTSMLDQHCNFHLGESYRTNILKSRARNLFKHPRFDTPPELPTEKPQNDSGVFASLGPESFQLLKDEIESVWKEKQIPEAQQALFRDCVFSLPKVKAAGVMAREIEDLKSNSALVQHALYAIATREQSLATLMEMNEYMSKCEDLDVLKELQQECAELLHAHRILTLAVVESIVKWREQMVYSLLMNSSEQALRRARTIPFMWHEANYLLKLKDDVNFLGNSAFAYLFNFSDRSDPFLIFTGTYDDSNYVRKTPKKAKLTSAVNLQLPGGKMLVPIPQTLIKRIRLAEMVILEEAVNCQGVQSTHSEPASVILRNERKNSAKQRGSVSISPQLKQILEDVQGEIIEETVEFLLPRLTNEVWNEKLIEVRPRWAADIFEDLVQTVITELAREELKAQRNQKMKSINQAVAEQLTTSLLASSLQSQCELAASEAVTAAHEERNAATAPLLADSLVDTVTREIVADGKNEAISEVLGESMVYIIAAGVAEEAVREVTEELRVAMLDMKRKQEELEKARLEAEQQRLADLEALKREQQLRAEEMARVKQAEDKKLEEERVALEARKKLEEEERERKRKEDAEVKRLRDLEEAKRLREEEEAKKAAEDKRRQEMEEAKKKQALEEAKLKKEAEEAKQKQKKEAEEAKQKQKKEAEEAKQKQKKEAEEAKQKQKKEAEEAKQKQKKEAEEAKQKQKKGAEEAKQKQQKEAEETKAKVDAAAKTEAEKLQKEAEEAKRPKELEESKKPETLAEPKPPEEPQHIPATVESNLPQHLEELSNPMTAPEAQPLTEEKVALPQEPVAVFEEEKTEITAAKPPEATKPSIPPLNLEQLQPIVDALADSAVNEAVPMVAESALQECRSELGTVREAIADSLLTELVETDAKELAKSMLSDVQEQSAAVCEAVYSSLLDGFLPSALADLAQVEINTSNLAQVQEIEAAEARDREKREAKHKVVNDLAAAVYDSLLEEWIGEHWLPDLVTGQIENEMTLTKKSTQLDQSQKMEMPVDYAVESFTPRVHSPIAYTPRVETPRQETAEAQSEEVRPSTGGTATGRYDLQFAEELLMRKVAQNPSSPVAAEETEIFEPDIPSVLEQYYKLLPDEIVKTLETPSQLIASMKRGIDGKWMWIKSEGKIIGLMAYYVDHLSKDARRVTCRHLSSLSSALYPRAIATATATLFETDPCCEVRVAIATDPRKELDSSIKSIYSQLGFKWKAVTTNWNMNVKMSIMGKARGEEAYKGGPVANLEITGSSTLKVVSTPVSSEKRPTQEMSIIGNKICILQVLGSIVNGQDTIVTPRAENRLQSDLTELLDIVQSTALSRFPYMTLSQPSPDHHQSDLRISVRWPSSETRVMETPSGVVEATRFISVFPTQDEVFVGTMMDQSQVYIVNTDDRNLCGFFMVAKDLREELQIEMRHMHTDLFSKVENMFRVSTTQSLENYSQRVPELWVPKFSLSVSGKLPWVRGLAIPIDSGDLYVAECAESLDLSCVSESPGKGQLLLRGASQGVQITEPFVFGTLHAGLIHKKVDSLLELPLFVAYIDQSRWMRISR